MKNFLVKRLIDVGDTGAPYQQKAIYFKPDCDAHILTGDTDGPNRGVLNEVPKLVD